MKNVSQFQRRSFGVRATHEPAEDPGKSIIGFDELGSPFGFDPSPGPGGTITSLTSSGTIGISAGNASLTISIEPFTGETTVQ